MMLRVILMFTSCFTMGKSCKIRECSENMRPNLATTVVLNPLKCPHPRGLIIHMSWNARTYIELVLI
jgi:hypothetical protein